ncbi:hypothetical protein [Rhodopseudomonas sp. RCAM05734]|uniref:hypothetical protein n=1 Tax=Rhodopseudomonas sp. RCAM05734 TaxID=3457549 RepID=UPI004044A9B4
MKFYLIMMFFVAAPAKPADRIWSLQSTMNMEFATAEACSTVGADIQNSLATTDTVAVRSYCTCESTEASKPCPSDKASVDFSDKFTKKLFRPPGSSGYGALVKIPNTNGTVSVKQPPPAGP